MSNKPPRVIGENLHKKADSVWRGANGMFGLAKLEKVREFYGRALAAAANKIMSPYNKEGTRTLEVGSGMGYLRHMVREWKGDWIQMEPSEDLAQQAKKRAEKRGGEDMFVVGTAYQTPFPDASMDTVAGLASYDVLHRLDDAVAETNRVLKPGGHFVHILDFRAPATPLMYMFDDAGVTYEYTPSEDDQTPSKFLIDTLQPAFKGFDQIVFEAGTYKGKRSVDLSATFANLLAASLERNGFQILSRGKQTGTFRGPRTGIQQEFPEVANFQVAEGKVVASGSASRPLPGLPVNQGVTEEIRVDVIIAVKPETKE